MKVLIWVLSAFLAVTLIATAQAAPAINQVDLIVFSDVHVGQAFTVGTSGYDNLTANQRYSMLLNNTNRYSTTIVNVGDLISSGTTQEYQQYQQLSKLSTNPILNVKGNHDFNNLAYFHNIGPSTLYGAWFIQTTRIQDMLLVSIGCSADTFEAWLYQGATYSWLQANFLNSVIHSAVWNQTSYHFLFMHFTPNSTWPIPAQFSVSPSITQYCRYFDIVFCGHEGGQAWTQTEQNATVVHCSHLGDSKITTDTYLTVQITRATHTITVSVHNFWKGITNVLLTQVR